MQQVTQDQGDVDFILQQIQIAESHAGGQPLSTLVPSPLLPWGLRTVDGTYNNLLPGQEHFGAADRLFPRLTPMVLREGEPVSFDPDGPGPVAVGQPTSYEMTRDFVFDSHPRVVSNLIADQTTANPAAVAAAEQNPGSLGNVDGKGTFFLPNVAPDVGLSASYNSWFTLFGQFFDHGLDLVAKGGSGSVIVPLKPDDPLFPSAPNPFMPLARATNLPGPDNVLGTADDVREHKNHTTSFVDQNQTYTSHPSHQVFLREYALNAQSRPVPTGRLLDGAAPRGGIATWREVKEQARNLLGINLTDADVSNVPLVSTDLYGRFLPGPNGFPQLVTSSVPREGNRLSPVSTSGAVRTGHPFLEDIAHTAAPLPGLLPDADSATGGQPPAGRYDDELLGAHFATGDGRGNENIGLTAVHFIFHAEHNRLVQQVKDLVLASNDPLSVAHWLVPGADPGDGVQELEWNGERLFQAARFGTEMQYQHLVFEEFARKVQPEVNLFAGYDSSIDPVIMGEFAHAVYRFGHSMLTETVARRDANGQPDDLPLIDAFLNPPAFTASGTSDADSAGAIIRGMSRQVGNEVDEFVTGALRNSLLGLPLDLASVNLARGRDVGLPPLNEARRLFFAETSNSALRPYQSWLDFGSALRHPESLVNFVAAYGTHPSVLEATTLADKRTAAVALVLGLPAPPVDASDFMNATGAWQGFETGLNLVDFWMGGLAEKQMVFGGLLGSTFNYVFETQLERLQDGDRLYYLARTAGLNFLTQLEQNTFAELIMRNTTVRNLPADVFSRPAFIFDLTQVLGAGGVIQDDPTTPENEAPELSRMPDSTVRYSGPEHVVFGGTDGDDRMWSSEGDDTLWGHAGNDLLEGGDGNDSLNGGDGDDIITDLNGIDNIKGGNGNDTINAGPGLGDLILAGFGHDFVVAGADPKETFAGHGNDFVIAGDSADIVFGGEGDDWIEGGGQADLLQGDNGNPFQDSRVIGHDVIIGNGGDDDYDAESGDDIMVSDRGVERHEGMLGFDWVTYKGETLPANADLLLRVLQPPAVDALRDRFDLVEGLSGWNQDDTLRGDSRLLADLTNVDATSGQNNALNDAQQLARIAGLQQLLGAGVTSFGAGNILLGGAGSDLIEGRGGDDLIDGDAWLNVRISVRDTNDNEIGTADSMSAVIQNKSGALAGTPSNLTLQAAMFAGTVSPGQLRIVREVLWAPAGASVDTAVFSDEIQNYDIFTDAIDGSTVVVHARGTQADGTDRLRNIERLQFADLTPPGPVTNLLAIPGNQQVTLSWTNPLDAAGVRILRSSAGFAALPTDTVNQTVVFDALATTFNDSGRSNGTTYFYTLFARDAAGNFSTAATVSAVPNVPLAPVISALSPTSGPVGSLVTLTGSNFLGATSVRFGATLATFTVVSATEISATVPAGAVSGVVTVAGPGGTGSSLTSFTVTVGPVISAFAPASGPLGTVVTIAGSGFTGASVVRFGGTSAQFSVISATQIQATVPVGATTGRISVTTVAGTGTSATDFTLTLSTIFTDPFDRANAATLGAGWTVTRSWSIANNQASGAGSGGVAIVSTAVPPSASVEATVRMGNGSNSGIVARASATDYYALRLRRSGGGRAELVRTLGGNQTVIARINFPVAANQAYRLRLQVSGTTAVRLVGSIDGVQVFDTVDNSVNRLPSGSAGLLSGASQATLFDDFVVTSP